MITRKLLLFPD